MSEKRFFKIFSQRHIIGDENQYLLLFDFIDSTENIDNETLLKQDFVRNISAEKNYLYRLLLKSLNAYYFEFSYKMKIQNYITSSEILSYKGLEDQALKLLNKAEKIAEKTELFTHLLTIKQTQFEVLSQQNKYGKALDNLQQSEKITSKHQNLIQSQLKATSLYKKRQELGGARSEMDIDTTKDFDSDNLNEPSDSVKKELYQKSLLINLLHSKRDYENEIVELIAIINLYEQNDFLIEYSVKGYISSLYNLANTHRNLKQYDKALLVLNKIDKLKSHKLIMASKFLSSYLFYLSNNLRLMIYIINKDFDKAMAHYLEIEKHYPNVEGNINKQLVYEHLILVIRMLIEFKDYKQALKYSNVIINDNEFKIREDILSYVRLLNLVIHYEMRNNFSLEYFSSSAKNYLKRKNRLFQTENQIIKFIMNFEKKNSNNLQKINLKLIELKTDPYEKSMYNLFDFQKWVEGKLDQL